MLKNLIQLGKDAKIKFDNYSNWQELTFTEKDKKKIAQLANVIYVYNHSIKFEFDNNHTIVPSQYLLYALAIKDFAMGLKEHLDVFDNYKNNKDRNRIGDEITNKSFNIEALGIDKYSQTIVMEPLFNSEYNFNAKSIINGNPGNYKVRGTSDFFASVILKIINVPDASSAILGKLIYYLSDNIELYNYIENRFIQYLPYLIKDKNIKSFSRKIFQYIFQYDSLERIQSYIMKNNDSSFSSIRKSDLTLTSIFKTSPTLLAEEDLKQGGRIRYYDSPLFYLNNEFYYFSNEWTYEKNSRLDLETLISILKLTYPEFEVEIDKNEYYLISSKTMSISISQKIYYGAPGTGKSYKVKKILDGLDKKYKERITFHPEFDYSSFIGGYKPITERNEKNNEDEIKYKFVPQSFTNIYVKAWKDLDNPYYLAIEEINRGNCAEIFGDIFQLLDRESNYTVSPSNELKAHLKGVGGFNDENHEGIIDGLKLPPNLNILATMNTSDQSLFPMDSAFKRRWDWEYIPINYNKTYTTDDGVKERNDSYYYEIILSKDKAFKWIDFIKEVNDRIKNNTNLGMDKCIGNYFIKATENKITLNEFVNKAIFYLWNDVFKDEEDNSIFNIKDNNRITYEDFFPINNNASELITQMLKELKVELIQISE